MSDIRAHLDAQAWRMALRGLCVGSEQNLVTPEQCAANVRARLNKMGAGPAPPAYVADLVDAVGKLLACMDRDDDVIDGEKEINLVRRCYHGALQVMPQGRLSKVNWNEAVSEEDE